MKRYRLVIIKKMKKKKKRSLLGFHYCQLGVESSRRVIYNLRINQAWKRKPVCTRKKITIDLTWQRYEHCEV